VPPELPGGDCGFYAASGTVETKLEWNDRSERQSNPLKAELVYTDLLRKVRFVFIYFLGGDSQSMMRDKRGKPTERAKKVTMNNENKHRTQMPAPPQRDDSQKREKTRRVPKLPP
jgi:hypothetical protein